MILCSSPVPTGFCFCCDKVFSIIDGHCSLSVSNSRRIAILGKTGVGKSSLANTILGEQLFRIGHSVNSETIKCQAETKPVNGGNITLIDTPGFFDTDRSEEELKSEILRCITEFALGPHAFLIVLKVERFTEHEQAIIDKIHQYFSEEVLQYASVLFTHGDQLPEGQTIEDFVHDNRRVKDLVEKCGGRCHVVDNKYWKNNQEEYRNNQVQVKELLKTIDKMVEANEGRCYTNEMLQAVEERIIQEVELIRQTAGNKSEGEIREEAKENVFKLLWTKLAGIASGALWGALLGLMEMASDIITALTQPGGAGMRGATVQRAVGVALRGAMQGAITGHNASEGADSPGEAAKKAGDAVMK